MVTTEMAVAGSMVVEGMAVEEEAISRTTTPPESDRQKDRFPAYRAFV